MLFTSFLIFCSFTQAQNESAKAGGDENWVATWGSAPGFAIGEEISNQTIRQFARISIGGKRVRLRLSNETGTQPLVVGAGHLAIAESDKGSIDPSSDHVLTFNGSRTITVPAGAPVLSNPIDLEVRPLTTLAKRRAVNEWIRTSKAFDGIIDLETAVCDPDHPGRLRPDYDSGDHGHLNDTGYRAMADSIDLELFANP